MVTLKLSIINYQFLKRAQWVSIFLIFMMNSFSFNSQVILNWEIKHARTKEWIPLGEKGSVQEALIQSGELPDPFYGKNEELFTWIEDYCWEFKSEFKWNKKKNEKVLLTFPNVDTYAKIYLNEVLISETNNAFVQYDFLIQENLKDGKNVLSVIFDSPTRYQQKHKSEVGVNLPAPNDVGKEKVASYCRKPQYQFGWDWALRMVTMGFWKPVTIESISFNKVLSFNSQTLSILPEKLQKFEVSFLEEIHGTITWESQQFGNKELKLDGKTLSRTENVDYFDLWWPRGHGAQNLYEDEWVFKNEAGEVIATKNIRFGVRKTELIQQTDKWGTSYEVKINDQVIFCKGGDYIPDDIFPARITNEKLHSNVETMVQSNFNMVRIWGGGMYATDYFLNLCDEMGLMVWHDFMFACAMYPGNESFLANVKNEINQQIPRITSHPAVVLLNGNNEVDVAWKNWGFQITYSISKSDQKIIEEYYKKLFLELIPTQVSAFSTVPYVHTSPLSNWGKDEYYNHGSQHYWGVWHGKDPMSDFAVKSGRFNAEYGFQSFPEYSTLLGFSKESDWSLDNEIMKHHQKSYVGNGMIKKHSDILFGETKDFKRFVYLSQLTQAKAVSTAIVSHRAQFPRVSGTLYWQVNDCWPAPSWSSIDYNLNWKALQYQVKKDFEDVTIAQLTNADQSQNFVLISDLNKSQEFQIKLSIFSKKGELLNQFEKNVIVNQNTTINLFENELLNIKEEALIQFECKEFPIKYIQGMHRSFVINDRKSQSNSSIEIKSIFEIEKGIYEMTFEVKDEISKDVWFYSLNKNLHFHSNFENFTTGIHVVEFYTNDKVELEDIMFQFR
jgi:beta-mannosidase